MNGVGLTGMALSLSHTLKTKFSILKQDLHAVEHCKYFYSSEKEISNI